MIYAGIDIGSNAGRLLVARVIENRGRPITEKISLVRVPLRLGLDVFDKGFITREKADLLVRTFEAYNKLLQIYKPIDVAVCATSAMRETANATDIIDKVKIETGFVINVITGLQEAKLISSSGNVNVVKKHRYSLYIDLGGGSIELTCFDGETLIESQSFDIGTIRVLLDKVKNTDWEELKTWIKNKIDTADGQVNYICSGGNINKLTKLFGNTERNTISYLQLSDGYSYLEGFPLDDRIKNMGLRPDRADVIVPAAIIFKKIMKWCNINEIQAPKIGLADGIIIDLFKKHSGLSTIL